MARGIITNQHTFIVSIRWRQTQTALRTWTFPLPQNWMPITDHRAYPWSTGTWLHIRIRSSKPASQAFPAVSRSLDPKDAKIKSSRELCLDRAQGKASPAGGRTVRNLAGRSQVTEQSCGTNTERSPGCSCHCREKHQKCCCWLITRMESWGGWKGITIWAGKTFRGLFCNDSWTNTGEFSDTKSGLITPYKLFSTAISRTTDFRVCFELFTAQKLF